MSNILIQLVRALVFAFLFQLSTVAIASAKTSSACIVGSAPSQNFDPQVALVANAERGAIAQLQCAHTTPCAVYGDIPPQSPPEPDNCADTVTAMY
jgi:spore coat protein U-like protein